MCYAQSFIFLKFTKRKVAEERRRAKCKHFKWNGRSLALKYLSSKIFKAAALVAKRIKTKLPAHSSNTLYRA